MNIQLFLLLSWFCCPFIYDLFPRTKLKLNRNVDSQEGMEMILGNWPFSRNTTVVFCVGTALTTVLYSCVLCGR